MNAQIAAQTARTPGPFGSDGAIVTLGDEQFAIAVTTFGPAASRAARIARALNAHDDLVAALQGVLRVADRNTAEFDAARAALAKAGAL